MKKWDRRRVLKGMLGGGAVTVALPLLDCFLNDNATALASGAPMPVRFGTWGYGCGGTASIFTPKNLGAGYDLPEEIKSWTPVRNHINLFSNTTAILDSAPNRNHFSGWVVARCGIAPTGGVPTETIDTTIANRIGRTTRFRSLTATASADTTNTFSYVNSATPNPAEWSPVKFYQRLFGADFQDPNVSSFTPDPKVMIRKSALSAVMEQTDAMMKSVGAADRARIDQYFTGLRQLENQFGQRLTKPEPIAACKAPGKIGNDPQMGKDIDAVNVRHRMMTQLMAMAVACDQTRVFNMAYSAPFSALVKIGFPQPHHTCTHEDPTDPVLGYQVNASWFTRRTMEAWADFVQTFADIREGDGTLLDNVLIYANTDVGYAKTHTVDGMPIFTAGRAGGRIKTGMHFDMKGASPTRIGYTALRTMGVDLPSWGTLSNETSEVMHEIIA